LKIHIPDQPKLKALRAEVEQFLEPARDCDGIAAIRIALTEKRAASDAYALVRTRTDVGPEYMVEASSTAGAAAGFHHLLRLMGFGFSFFADTIPELLGPVEWPFDSDRAEVTPDFAVRGLLPWHNFLNSPTVWNPEDYERYLKTLWRWGGNTAIFHSYDEEPLAAFPDPATGEWRAGAGMQTTLDAPWGGVKGIKLEEFGHGSGDWFPFSHGGAWGARNAFAEDPIAVAQSEFARACEFGAGLGLNVVFGFELLGDPCWPGYRELLAARLRHVLATYPSLGTLCLWEQEGHGVRGWQEGDYSSDIAGLEKKFGHAFGDLKTSPARYREGLRLAALFEMAYEVVREIRPDIRIAFAGWGGERWMRWGDYWPGLNRMLPPDAILAQLDNIMPHCQETVSSVAAEIASKRELWSIPWVESDGGGGAHNSQWHPQDAVALQTHLALSAKQIGYAGLLGIHWQTAGCEINAMHLVQCAGWNAAQSGFYAEYARTFFSSGEASSEVAAILWELEDLGPSWTGAGQQTECSRFEWAAMPRLSPGDVVPEEMAALEAPLWAAREAMFCTQDVDVPIIAHFDNLLFRFATQKLPTDTTQRLERLRTRFVALNLSTPHARRLLAAMDFVLAFEAIKSRVEPRGELARRLELLLQMKNMGLAPDSAVLAEYQQQVQSVENLWLGLFAAQKARLDTPGDFGNLANINLKAWQAWRKFSAQSAEISHCE
jgi:hypothetical protein